MADTCRSRIGTRTASIRPARATGTARCVIVWLELLRRRCLELSPRERLLFAGSWSLMWILLCDFVLILTTLPALPLQACILSSIFRASPALGQGFNRTIETLRAKRTLSIALYIRTGATEDNHRKRRFSDGSTEAAARVPGPGSHHTIRRRFTYASVVLCALQLERRWAAGYDKVAWYVSTDQRDLAAAIVSEFDESAGGTNARGRTVLTSKNEGIHSAPKYRAEMPDGLYEQGVTDAVKDWWTLGETDLGVFTPRAETTTHGGAFARCGWLR